MVLQGREHGAVVAAGESLLERKIRRQQAGLFQQIIALAGQGVAKYAGSGNQILVNLFAGAVLTDPVDRKIGAALSNQ
ncbi:MAG: hypothetical protein DSZ33_00635 [Gammaproteobacteria bacterium]|nr:MAG: hypothetical protein DSZ33_00635 [Gammaproteobacteria bacterium]